MAHYSRTLFHEYMDNIIARYWNKMAGTHHRLIAKHLLIMAMEDEGSDPDLWIPNSLLDDFRDEPSETEKRVGFSEAHYKNFLISYDFPVSKGPFFYFIVDTGENGVFMVRTMFPLPFDNEVQGEYLRKSNGEEAYFESFVLLNPEKEKHIVNFAERIIEEIEEYEQEKKEIQERLAREKAEEDKPYVSMIHSMGEKDDEMDEHIKNPDGTVTFINDIPSDEPKD